MTRQNTTNSKHKIRNPKQYQSTNDHCVCPTDENPVPVMSCLDYRASLNIAQLVRLVLGTLDSSITLKPKCS